MFPVVSSEPKGGLKSKLHTVCGGDGWPIILLLSEGKMSNHKGDVSGTKKGLGSIIDQLCDWPLLERYRLAIRRQSQVSTAAD